MRDPDETIDLVLQMLRPVRKSGAARVITELVGIAEDCIHEECRRAARTLLNDYEHLRDNGLSERKAVQTILAPRKGETRFEYRDDSNDERPSPPDGTKS